MQKTNKKHIIVSKQLCHSKLWRRIILPGIRFLLIIAPANVIKTQHKHTIEILRNHLIQLNMCPIDGLLSAMAVPWLEDCSSIEMRIVNNQHREIANDYEEFLLNKKRNIINVIIIWGFIHGSD